MMNRPTPSRPVHATLFSLLQKHAEVLVQDKYWVIGGKLSYWPETGRYKLSVTAGGKSGSLRGSPDSNAEQLLSLLKGNG